MTKTGLILVLLLLTLGPALAQQKKAAPQNCRDAVTGAFVTQDFAKAHPTTTVCEAARKPPPKK